MADVGAHKGSGVRYADMARWLGSLCLVLALHVGISLAVLRNLDTVSAPAAPPALVMIDLPVDALLPKAESVESIASEEVAKIEPAEVVRPRTLRAEEPVEVEPDVEEEEPPPEEAVETPPDVVEAVTPTEVNENAIAVAELVRPTETVTAEPVEKPPPKPRKRPPPPVKQKASNASNNSVAAAGAGRSNPEALKRYLSEVRARILRHRRSVPANARGRVTIRATIARSGTLSGIGISRSSGNAALDNAALAIVRRVGRVPPIPPAIGRPSIALNIPFSFTGR